MDGQERMRPWKRFRAGAVIGIVIAGLIIVGHLLIMLFGIAFGSLLGAAGGNEVYVEPFIALGYTLALMSPPLVGAILVFTRLRLGCGIMMVGGLATIGVGYWTGWAYMLPGMFFVLLGGIGLLHAWLDPPPRGNDYRDELLRWDQNR